MPSRTQSYYDLDDVVGSVGPAIYGVTASFSGYGESGGIEYSVEENLHESTGGADGHVAISKNNVEIVIATFTVMAGTSFCRNLSALAQAQYRAPSPVGLPFTMVDPNLGDTIFEKQAWFQSLPGPTKEDVEAEREFELILPHARNQIVHATNVTP